MLIYPFIVIFAVLGIATAGDVKQLPRKGYALRVSILLIVYYVFGFVLAASRSVELFLATAPIHLAAVVIATRWSAHRLNHIGRSRWWALSLSLPLLNLIPVLALCLIPG
jgi:uncharacterized membrane protein YhaH (DUF805 family)